MRLTLLEPSNVSQTMNPKLGSTCQPGHRLTVSVPVNVPGTGELKPTWIVQLAFPGIVDVRSSS